MEINTLNGFLSLLAGDYTPFRLLRNTHTHTHEHRPIRRDRTYLSLILPSTLYHSVSKIQTTSNEYEYHACMCMHRRTVAPLETYLGERGLRLLYSIKAKKNHKSTAILSSSPMPIRHMVVHHGVIEQAIMMTPQSFRIRGSIPRFRTQPGQQGHDEGADREGDAERDEVARRKA